MPKVFYTGTKFKVVFTDLAESCFLQLADEVKPHGMFENLVARIRKFADFGAEGLHTPEQLNDEGDGFYAIKARGAALRAYFWYCQKERGVIVVSHLIKKKKQKLDPQDKATMELERKNYKG